MLTSTFTNKDYRRNACIKHYPNGTFKITVFSRGIFNPDGFVALDDVPKIREDGRGNKADWDGVVRGDNLKRAKDKIFDIAFANCDLWQYMVTFTLDAARIDRYDEKEVGKRFKKWLNNQVHRKNCKYLIVPERHKDGAIHFHGLLSGDFKLADSGRKDKAGRPIYNMLDYPFGFSTIVKLDDQRLYVAKYITKYITKGTEKVMGNFIIAAAA